MTALNNYALDIASSVDYKAISDAGTKAAVLTIATQLQGFRFQGTATAAALVLRDLITDILAGQRGQVAVGSLPPAASTELLITDSTTQTAMATVRAYLASGLGSNVPPVGALQSHQAFGLLANLIVQSI